MCVYTVGRLGVFLDSIYTSVLFIEVSTFPSAKREKIIDEILTTEMAYIKDLTDIIDVRETWSI